MGLSAPSLAFQGLSLIMGGMASAQGDAYQAAQSKEDAQIAKIQGLQTSTAYADNLNTTISNIKAIRAATGADPNSPSTAAYIQTQTDNSDRDRDIAVTGKEMEADQYSSDAMFYNSAASSALLGGAVKSLPYFAQAYGLS